MHTRHAALLDCLHVLRDQHAYNGHHGDQTAEPSFVKALCFEFFRHYFALNALTEMLLDKPFKPADEDVHCLLMLGLVELGWLSTPVHAVINETVDVCQAIQKPWAKGVINACLRRFEKDKETLLGKVGNVFGPFWLIKLLKKAYPDQWRSIAEESVKHAPMFLRVREGFEDIIDNTLHPERDPHALRAQDDKGRKNLFMRASKLRDPLPIHEIPKFNEGSCYVQDLSPQFAPFLMDLEPNQRVLDACAAPGGKSLHILEVEPSIDLLCLDADEKRLERLAENFKRYQLTPNVVCAPAEHTDQWFDGNAFDRILLDAPCSATGVIRRHPDIQLLRKETDIQPLAALQGDILDALWATLKPGGILLYATCSILPIENDETITHFLSTHDDVALEKIELPIGHQTQHGWQILPGDGKADGFYYAKLSKRSLGLE